MSRRTKILIIILGILLILGSGYYGLAKLKTKKAGTELSGFPPPVRIGKLEALEIVKIETSGITLEKNDGIWELVFPEGRIPSGEIELDQYRAQLMVFSLASVWVQNIVEEEPQELSVYGLDNSLFRTTLTDAAGRKAEYILGDITPSRDSYYIMEEGDPRVYTVSANTAALMSSTLDSIRQRNLFPNFELPGLALLRLETAETKVEIRVKAGILLYIIPFSNYALTSPYFIPRGVRREELNNLIEPLSNLTIIDYIDDAPASLIPYGLDKPARIFLLTEEGSLDLLIGDRIDGKRYAKLADAPNVFTLSGMEGFVNVKPFSLIDKFLFPVIIDDVDRLTINGEGKLLTADIRGIGDDAVFFLNGEKAEDMSFRQFYEAVIGLRMDTEYTGPALQSEDGEITIEFQLNKPLGGRASVAFIPYNRDFYAVWQNGNAEFLISRSQIRRIYGAADKVIFE